MCRSTALLSHPETTVVIHRSRLRLSPIADLSESESPSLLRSYGDRRRQFLLEVRTFFAGRGRFARDSHSLPAHSVWAPPRGLAYWLASLRRSNLPRNVLQHIALSFARSLYSLAAGSLGRCPNSFKSSMDIKRPSPQRVFATHAFLHGKGDGVVALLKIARTGFAHCAERDSHGKG